MDPLEGAGLIAELPGGRRCGLVAWLFDPPGAGAEAEIRVLVVEPDVRGRGVGAALMAATEANLRASRARGAWLVTTNNNRAAIALYERSGYRLREVRYGAIDEVRRTLKPSIPECDVTGTPITDELEYAIDLGA